jgi:hypothetical protein
VALGIFGTSGMATIVVAQPQTDGARRPVSGEHPIDEDRTSG